MKRRDYTFIGSLTVLIITAISLTVDDQDIRVRLMLIVGVVGGLTLLQILRAQEVE